MKFRWLWLPLIALCLVSAKDVIQNGFRIDSDIFSVLPVSGRDEAFQQAKRQYQDHLSRQAVFLVLSSDPEDFARHLKSCPGVDSVKFQWSEQEFGEVGKFYFERRLQLFTPAQVTMLYSAPQQVVQAGLTRLYSPVSSSGFGALLDDPLGWFTQFLTRFQSYSGLELRDSHLMGSFQGKAATLVTGELVPKISVDDQLKFSECVDGYSASEVLKTGVPFYMASGWQGAQSEVALIGLGSTLGTLILLALIFLSAVPLVATLGLIAVSMLTGTLVTHYMFGSIHMFTLVTASSLIGLFVDFSFHFFAQFFSPTVESGKDARNSVFVPLTQSFWTAVLGFSLLIWSKFLTLQQLTCFAIVGFLTTYLVVLTFYPWLKLKNRKPGRIWQRLYAWPNFLGHLTLRRRWQVVGVLFVLSVVLILPARFDDSIRSLQALPKALKAEEEAIRSVTGLEKSSAFLLVKGGTTEQLLQEEEKIRMIQGDGSEHVDAISNWVPSLKLQAQSHQALEAYQKVVKLLFDKAGIAAKPLPTSAFQPFSLEEALDKIGQLPIGRQFLGQIGEPYFSVMHFNEAFKELYLASDAKFNAKLVDHANDSSVILQGLRVSILYLALLGWLVAFLALAIFWYGFLDALLIMSVPTISATLSLAASFWVLDSLNIFNFLAAMLTFGLGIDYAIYYMHNRGKVGLHTLIAVTASVLTTGLSFGLMAFSGTAAIAGFGLTIACGVALSGLISPLASK